MNDLARHLLSQRKVIVALGQVALDALLPRSKAPSAALSPRAELRARVAPPSEALIRDYVASVGGTREAYRDKIPAHLFPHWSFPPLVSLLRPTRYPLARALNAGCRLQMNAPLSSARELDVCAQLIEVRDDGHRALLHTRLTTGQEHCADALVADTYAVVPSRSRGGRARRAATRQREEPPVMAGAHALQRFVLSRRAGLSFALFTGDVNPIHWLAPYARAAGFPGPILHGFALLARSYEALVHTRCQGLPERLRALDVRFTRPLPLPAEVTLYAQGDRICVTETAESAPYMLGTCSLG